MAALKTRTFSSFGRSGGASRWGNFSVFVDATSVLELLDSIEEAVSPPALMYFMENMVAPYFQDQVVDTFADLGGGSTPGGSWAPLQESTLRIRHTLGYYDDYAINERTGRLLEWLLTHNSEIEALGAVMTVPDPHSGFSGNGGIQKLETAQKGRVQGSDDMIPGAYTPPRPVLALTSEDTMAVHVMLQTHIANWVSFGFLQGGTL